eukprot:scaffold323975_cov58-Attheya_sp.AAC.1
MEAEILKAAQGKAEGRYVMKHGLKHPINKRNGFVSDWPVGHSGCFSYVVRTIVTQRPTHP